MADKNLQTSELKNISYELFIGAISILSIFNIITVFFIKDIDVAEVIFIINAFLTLIFLIDFLYRFITANSRKNYFFKQFGWADLISSIPLPFARLLRIFRLIRVYLLLNLFGAKGIIRELLNARGGSALLTILFIALLVFEFGGMAIIAAERNAADATIKTSSDSLWWIMATVTTVGYGDVYPTTNVGRFIGVLVMITGIGLFGTLTGYLANIFLKPNKE